MIVVAGALTECRSCYSRELRSVLKLESVPLGDKFSKIPNREERHPVRLVNCDSCGLVQFDGIINSAAIFEIPKASEVESIIEEDCATDFGYTQQTLKIDGAFDYVWKTLGDDRKRIISLEGYLLSEALRESRALISWEECLSAETVDRFLARFGQVDQIIIDNSNRLQHPLHISNVGDVRSYAAHLSRILKKSGEISVRFPAIFPLLISGLVGYVYHEHQSFFCSESISRVFSEVGLTLSRARYCHDGLNADLSFTRGEKVQSPSWETTDLKTLEARYRPQKERMLWDLRVRLDMCIEELEKQLKFRVFPELAGFGASVAGISLMYQLRLEHRLNFLFDDSDHRLGQLSPEGNLEVKKPIATRSSDSMATVILVPLYAETIASKHKGKLGTVVNPRLRLKGQYG